MIDLDELSRWIGPRVSPINLDDVMPDLGVAAAIVNADAHRVRVSIPTPAAFVAGLIVRELVAEAPSRRRCEAPPIIECPRGCRFVTSALPHVQWGPWRMQVHLMNERCPAAIPGMTTTTRGRR